MGRSVEPDPIFLWKKNKVYGPFEYHKKNIPAQ